MKKYEKKNRLIVIWMHSANYEAFFFLFFSVPNFNLETMDVTVNAVASAIKLFFKSLPEPILPYDMQHELIDKYNRKKRDHSLSLCCTFDGSDDDHCCKRGGDVVGVDTHLK